MSVHLVMPGKEKEVAEARKQMEKRLAQSRAAYERMTPEQKARADEDAAEFAKKMQSQFPSC
jgi:hypothetical protein